MFLDANLYSLCPVHSNGIYYKYNSTFYCVVSNPCRFSSSSMASSSSVRLASMFPMSFKTSAGSARGLRGDGCELTGRLLVDADGDGGIPGRAFITGYSAGRIPARVLIVPAFSFANGRESDSVLELD